MRQKLILNPTENLPMNIEDDFDSLSGFYISDNIRTIENKIIFAGRNEYTEKLNTLKNNWCKALNAADIDIRFLSGLHAHIITFMSLGNIGDTILLLPESAGGHYSTEAILKRLGYNIISMIPDNQNHCIDIYKTIEIINTYKPKFAFVDRSEGLYYEDFAWLKRTNIPYCIFDCSQYLTQIISNDYTSPFEWGFDLILSSTHKNYPGVQKAFLATLKQDENWKKIKNGSATYISNSHPSEMFKIAQSITYIEDIKKYSKYMIRISNRLENALAHYGFPVMVKDSSKVPTQHIWATFQSKEECYKTFINLEKLGLLTNYRLLPYNLNHGLRIGVGAAIQQGLREENVSDLAMIFHKCYQNGFSKALESDANDFLNSIIKEKQFI